MLVHGVHYERLPDPIKEIGALIDSEAANKVYGQAAPELMATAGGIPLHRVTLLLRQTGLQQVQHRQIGEFSMGMRQRLGIAAALLGDPKTVILDEPFNGLDVDGIKWLRSLAKELASQNKAVFISSHLMSEVEAIADRVIVLAQGRLIADMTISELVQRSLGSFLRVRSEDNETLSAVITKIGGVVQGRTDGFLLVRGVEAEEIGWIAKRSNLAIFELTGIRPSLEDLFVELTAGRVEFKGQAALDDGGEGLQ